MATIKTEWVNLTSNLTEPGNRDFTMKLDAWRITFYFWSDSTKTTNLLVNGLPLALFAHDFNNGIPTGGYAGNGPLVIELGGAHYKGRPIQMDDEVRFSVKNDGRSERCAFMMVKQYFVEDRPGPDRMLGDSDPNLPPSPKRAPTRTPTRPASAPRPSRPVVYRAPNRNISR